MNWQVIVVLELVGKEFDSMEIAGMEMTRSHMVTHQDLTLGEGRL